MMRENLSKADLPGPGTDWRELQKRQTRQRIVHAVHQLVAETGRVTVPQVSERSGVSPATIYRYFPNREELLGAAAYEHVDTELRPGSRPISMDEYRQVVHKVFAAHEADLAAVIAGHSTPAGRHLRRVRGENRRAIIRENVAAAGIDPAGPSGRRLVAVMGVIASSRSFLEFREMTDLDIEEAADAVAWAVEALIAATVNDPDDGEDST